MKTDAELEKDIRDQLLLEPSIDATHVAVAVKDGAVTLTGYLGSCAERHALAQMVPRVRGVSGLTLTVEVHLPAEHQRSDQDIESAAEAALHRLSILPRDKLQLIVHRGWVILDGEVDSVQQREAAEDVVYKLCGVVGVRNRIALAAPRPSQACV